MSSAIVTTILLVVMLLIIGSFVFSAWLAHRRHMNQLKQEPPDELSTTTGRMMVVVQLLDGSVVGLENQVPIDVTKKVPAIVPSAHLTQHWYNRQRTVVSLGLLFMLALGLLIETGVAGDAFHSLTAGLNLAGSQVSSAGLPTTFQPLPDTASSRIVRVDSALADQYYTTYQYQVWSYSSCSGISLEEVMNAYGHHYIAADVLQEEQNLGVWNTYQGLTGGEPGMAKTAAYFGFKASPNPPRTLAAVIQIANEGYPVIIGSVGHIMVVKGGDANYVYVVDSSPANRQVMTHDQFLNFWDGFSVLVTPDQYPQPS
jgi:uncharacterized protein YneF (UPF0154 family)